MTAMISGHLDLTEKEFETHYLKEILRYAKDKKFIVADADGCDAIAQRHLALLCKVSSMCGKSEDVTVYHMFDSPRNNVGNFKTIGGFKSDEERDAAMTAASDYDIAWVRPGRENSGTARNIKRRNEKVL